ncbi:hypothetical protein M1N90_00450 [Dehalococcoidia bacterium]|nr:hypothetical protein [Dehalococcoidia bacterium]
MNTLNHVRRNINAICPDILWRLLPIFVGILVLTPYLGVLLDHHYLDNGPMHSHFMAVGTNHHHVITSHDYNDPDLIVETPIFYKNSFANTGFCSDYQSVYTDLVAGPTGHFNVRLVRNDSLQKTYLYPELKPPIFGI